MRAPALSSYPPALLDVALVVPAAVPAASVADALRDGAGSLLESLRLFDVYADPERLGPDVRSLAYALRFRAAGPDADRRGGGGGTRRRGGRGRPPHRRRPAQLTVRTALLTVRPDGAPDRLRTALLTVRTARC